MKRRIKLTPILIALILSLSASLTSCNDSETGTDSASVTVSQTEKETDTQSVTDTEVETDSITSEAPTDNIVTEAPAEDTEAPETNATTTAPETEAPETKPAVTTAPETTAPEVKKEYASKEEYPDDWGEENNMLRTDGKTFFWKKSRVMHTIPKGITDVRYWLIVWADEKNDQLIFFVEGKENSIEIYSMVKGVFYKLNTKKVISTWNDDTGPIYFIEEDGTAKSVNVRSKKYNEVYIEAEGVRAYGHRINSFETFDGKLVKPNSENILATVKEIK